MRHYNALQLMHSQGMQIGKTLLPFIIVVGIVLIIALVYIILRLSGHVSLVESLGGILFCALLLLGTRTIIDLTWSTTVASHKFKDTYRPLLVHDVIKVNKADKAVFAACSPIVFHVGYLFTVHRSLFLVLMDMTVNYIISLLITF